jgi:Cu+-exporting ATPase
MHSGGEYYFEVSGIFIGFMIIGNSIEDRVKKKTNDHLESFLQQSNLEIEVFLDGAYIKKKVEDVSIGDIILIKPGENVALDGVIVESNSEFDEHAITGENTYKFKTVGDNVFAQTINIINPIKVRVTNTFENSLFQKIINSADELASIEPKTKVIANKIASIFVPSVILIAIITFLVLFFGFKYDLSKSLMQSLAVIVVSCPCALGLATPISIISIINTALKEGILIKSADLFEVGTNVKAIGFDKTGTITNGNLNVISYEGSDDNLLLASSIEHLTNHPISKAITNYYEASSQKVDYLPIENLEVIAGFGLKGYYKNEEVLIGNNNPYDPRTITDEISLKIFLIIKQKVVSTFTLQDEIKQDASILLKTLHNQGIKTYLISGDNQQRTSHIAGVLGFDGAFGGTSPIDKSDIVEVIKKDLKGNFAWVGDGINDIIAGGQSDISFSVYDANDINSMNSSVCLLKPDLGLVTHTLFLARKARINIIENYIWAFGYNLVMIPLAITGVISATIAGIGMSVSSIIVVINALRLRFIRRKKNGN